MRISSRLRIQLSARFAEAVIPPSVGRNRILAPTPKLAAKVPLINVFTRGTSRIRCYFACGLLPSVAQPPLPLQEFLPLQLLSPVLQPPCPLQSFLPLQECLPFSASRVWMATPALVGALLAA